MTAQLCCAALEDLCGNKKMSWVDRRGCGRGRATDVIVDKGGLDFWFNHLFSTAYHAYHGRRLGNTGHGYVLSSRSSLLPSTMWIYTPLTFEDQLCGLY